MYIYIYIYIYIYAFSRRFYPKRLTVHWGYTFFFFFFYQYVILWYELAQTVWANSCNMN